MFRALASLIQSVLDIVLPRKERVVRIENYSLEDIPVSPAEHESCGVQITTLMSYRVQIVDDLIRALKYDRFGHAATLLAGVLAEYLREEIANIRSFSPKPVVLVPIPLHRARHRERGFNQVESILSELPREFKDGSVSRVLFGALTRTRDTAHQTRLSRSERLKNVADAFALTDSVLDDAHVILIDDVTTTGATLSEAAKPFAGKTATLLALAHA